MSVIVSCKRDIDLSEVFPNFELSLANESTGNLEKEKNTHFAICTEIISAS